MCLTGGSKCNVGCFLWGQFGGWVDVRKETTGKVQRKGGKKHRRVPVAAAELSVVKGKKKTQAVIVICQT